MNPSKPTLLLVEDDSLIADLLKKKFVLEGYTLFRAGTADEAHQLLNEHHRIDLILLDLLLPGRDGFSFLQEIKNDPRRSSIPVIIISNLGQEADISRGLALGAESYLIKANFTPKEVLEEVESVLKSKKQR